METVEVAAPVVVPLERLEAEITELAGNLAAAECRWLGLIAEYDRRAGYEQWGCRTCAHWLSWHCGLDLRAARERVRVARALEELPQLTAEFAAGRLSYSKVRALTRVATPANEADLVMIAEHATASQVEQTVRTYRRVLSADEETAAANERHMLRFVRFAWADDGSLEGSFRFPPEMGALFVNAVARAREHVPDDENGPAEHPREVATTNCDAVAMMAEAFLARAATGSGGDRFQVVVIADEAVVAGDADGICELDHGPALAPETVRRIMCNASIVPMVRDAAGELVPIGPKAPAIPAATNRAIRRRDRGCRFPGCSARAFTQIHHLQHRARGGSNEHRNLLELCFFHHRLVHEGGWNLRLDHRGEVLAIRPDGNVLREPPGMSAPDNATIESMNARRGVNVEPTTCIPGWRGERLDLDHIVTGLLCVDRPEWMCN